MIIIHLLRGLSIVKFMFVLDFARVRLAIAEYLRAGVELHIKVHFVARVGRFDSEANRFHRFIPL